MAFNKEAERDRKKGTALLPAMGFILIVAFGVISWFLSPYVQSFLARPPINAIAFQPDPAKPEMHYLVTAVMFLFFVLMTALVYAIAMPRARDNVRDMDIAKERKEIEQARIERKARRRKVKKDMKKM